MAFISNVKTRNMGFVRRKQRTQYFWAVRNKALSGNAIARRSNTYRYLALMRRNNADIPLKTQIAGMPVFPHGLSGIFMSEGACLGTDCVIFHQVTIGSNTLPGSRGQGCPTIGNNVYIGCGAKIIGNVHIGDNVRIGANCVVTQDIPANATVVLERPRVLVRDTPQDNRFLSHDEMVAAK